MLDLNLHRLYPNLKRSNNAASRQTDPTSEKKFFSFHNIQTQLALSDCNNIYTQQNKVNLLIVTRMELGACFLQPAFFEVVSILIISAVGSCVCSTKAIIFFLSDISRYIVHPPLPNCLRLYHRF